MQKKPKLDESGSDDDKVVISEAGGQDELGQTRRLFNKSSHGDSVLKEIEQAEESFGLPTADHQEDQLVGPPLYD